VLLEVVAALDKENHRSHRVVHRVVEAADGTSVEGWSWPAYARPGV
jgi:hypothetical protein